MGVGVEGHVPLHPLLGDGGDTDEGEGLLFLPHLLPVLHRLLGVGAGSSYRKAFPSIQGGKNLYFDGHFSCVGLKIILNNN